MEFFIFLFADIYTGFILPVLVFIFIFLVIGGAGIILSKLLYKQITDSNFKYVLLVLIAQTLFIQVVFYHSFSIEDPVFLEPILLFIDKSQAVFLKLFELFSQQDSIFRSFIHYLDYIYIFTAGSVLVSFVLLLRIRKIQGHIDRFTLFSFPVLLGLLPSLVLGILFSTYLFLPGLHPVGVKLFPVRHHIRIEMASDASSQERLDKMLTFAARISHATILDLLLKNGANPNAYGEGGNPALLVATEGLEQYGNRETAVRRLLQAGADINLRDYAGTPLISKLLESHLSTDMKKYILGLHPNLNAYDRNGSSPAMLLYSHGRKDLSWNLIEKGAGINRINNDGESLLSMALKKNDREFADELIDRGARMNSSVSVSASSKKRVSAAFDIFTHAALNSDKRIMTYMLDNGFDINARDRSGQSAVELAVKRYDKEMIAFLLEKGADSGQTRVLGEAVRRSDTEFAKYLLGQGIPVGDELLDAVLSNNEDMAKLLLEHGAATAVDAQTAEKILVRTVNSGQLNTVKMLLEHGVVAAVDPRTVERELEHAAEKGMDSMVSLLLDHNVLPRRSLNYAVKNGHLDTVKLLLARGAEIDSGDVAAYHGTPLVAATGKSDAGMVRFLLNRGADPNILTRDGNSALREAVRVGNREIILLLLEAGADPNVENEWGWRPISISDMKDSPRIVEVLLARKFDLNHQDKNGRTELAQAADFGREDLIQFLLDLGADPNFVNKYGVIALRNSVSRQKPGVTQLLLEHGSNPNLLDRQGRSCLWNAVENANPEIVSLLLEHGARLDERNSQGQTLLWVLAGRTHRDRMAGISVIAAQYQGKGKSGLPSLGELYDYSVNRDIETARILLEHGLDPATKDVSEQDAITTAQQNQNEKLALLLKEYLK